MEIEPTPLKDCYVIHNDLHKDDRGHFMEAYNRTQFKNLDLIFRLNKLMFVIQKKCLSRPPFSPKPFAQTKMVMALSELSLIWLLI